MQLPHGPSPEQVIRDRAGMPSKFMTPALAIDILIRRRANCVNLQQSLRWAYRDGRKPNTEKELSIRAAEWAYQCEIDAIDLAIGALAEYTQTVGA